MQIFGLLLGMNFQTTQPKQIIKVGGKNQPLFIPLHTHILWIHCGPTIVNP